MKQVVTTSGGEVSRELRIQAIDRLISGILNTIIAIFELDLPRMLCRECPPCLECNNLVRFDQTLGRGDAAQLWAAYSSNDCNTEVDLFPSF